MTNIKNDSSLASAPGEKSEQRWNQATRAIVGLSVCICLLFISRGARAFSLTSVITDVTSIANIESQINGGQTSMNNYNSNVVAPPLQLASLQTWLNLAEGSYQSWFASVLGTPISSASLTSTSALENAQLAGYSGGTGSGVASNYSTVYGSRLTSSTATTGPVTSVDMSDTAAQEAMTLATNSDNSTMQLLSLAKTLQQKASSTAPGTAGQVEAQSQALQLQSTAMMHHLLASMLREASTQIATAAANVKSTSTTHGTVYNSISGAGTSTGGIL